ncbi:MAG TPA: hypothetical protein VKF59_04620 [Candidatus Dormibacteraeota bacterium]|nr:hypothetical protein [Candidatus Dormibacteraeota bacterium]
MLTLNTVAQMLVRVCGLVQVVLGVIFWTGGALALLPVHILVGLLLVLALWTVALVGLRSGAGAGLAVVALDWGVVVVILGLTQGTLLNGGAHWVVQALHLVVGLAAIGLAERVGALTRRRLTGAVGATAR